MMFVLGSECIIDGCDREARYRPGWCNTHYSRWRKHGDANAQVRERIPYVKPTSRHCSIDGCERPVHGRGWCRRHYTCWWRGGDPNNMKLPLGSSLAERLDHFLDKSAGADGCWPWTGSRLRGYGHCWDGTVQRPAHRLAWELENGPIPAGLHVLHHCDNPPCCNPAHLFLGTQAENMQDMVRKGRHWLQKQAAGKKRCAA